MKISIVDGPGHTDVVERPDPTVGPRDVLVKVRACGICGTDAFYISIGRLPPHQGAMPLGHEPAGEIVAVGREVTDLAVGDHVVVDPMASPDDIIGNGGARGALAELLLVHDAVRGKNLEVIPDYVPFEVAALNEPMAVARHAVNQVAPGPADKVVVFGAGPIGLGATIALKSRGVGHVVVVDVLPARLEKAFKVGADAVVNSAEDDLAARLTELHGSGDSVWPGKAGTDVYLDAAGVPAVIDSALALAKRGSKLGVVAVHKKPVTVDLINVMSNEITIVGSMGYPTEIFEVTRDIVADWEKYAVLVSHTFGFDDVDEALGLAATPGAADKIVVTFD